MRIRVIDLECTGLAPPEHAVCEVGWCDVVKDEAGDWRVRVEAKTSCLLHPGRSIPPEANAVHHLVDDDVASAPFWAIGALDVFRSGPDVVAFAAHQAKFDRQWITPVFTGNSPWICTYKCALRLWPDAPGHSNQVLRYWRKPVGLGRDLGPTHRAGPDAIVTAFLLRDMLNTTPIADLIAWSDEPALLPRLTMGKYHNGGKGTPWAEVETGYLDWMLKPGKDFDEDLLHSVRVELRRRAGWSV